MSVQCPCDVHDVMLAMLLVSNLLLNGNLVRFEPWYLSACGGSKLWWLPQVLSKCSSSSAILATVLISNLSSNGLRSQYFSNKLWSGLNESWYLSCTVGISQRSHRKSSSSTNSQECHVPDIRSSPCLLSLVRFLSPTLTIGSVLYWEDMQDWFAVEHRLFDREMDITMVMNQTHSVLWCRTVELL